MFDERLLQAHGEDSAFPRDWRVMSLADVCEQVTDGSHFSPKPQAQGCPIANVKDLENGHVDIESCTKIKKEDFHALIRNGCDVRKHDVLLSKDGTIGKVVIYQQDEPLVALSSIAVLRPGEAINASFLGQALQSPYLNRQFALLAGGSALRRLVLRDINRILIPTPPLNDQLKIAAVLDVVDEAIAKTEAVIAKLKQLRTGLLHDLLTRGLDEHGQLRDPISHPEQFKDSPMGRIPREWKVSTVGQLQLQIIDGDRGSNYPNESQLFDQGFCVFLNNKNIVDGSIDFSAAQFISEERDSLLGKGKLNLCDIVITTRGTVGNIALFGDLHPHQHVRINSGMIILRAYESVFVSQFFVALWKFLFPSEYRRLSSGSAQPQFPIRDMQQFRLLIPKRLEQERIISASSSAESALAQEHRTLGKLQVLKSGLMTDLLTGRVRVPESLSAVEAQR